MSDEKKPVSDMLFLMRLMMLAVALLPRATDAADTARFATQYAEGRKHYDAGKYDDAIRVYGEIIRLDPQQDSAYTWRSLSYTKKNMHPQSLEDARRAAELVPSNPTYRYNLGFDYYYANQYDQALAEFEQAEKLGFKQALLFRYRAATKLGKGLNAEAIADATEALNLSPGDAFASGVRARALLRSEKYKEAIEDYSNYLRTYTSDNFSMAEQGYAYYKLGMLEEAKRNAEKLLELEPRLTVNFSGDQALGIYDRDMRRAKVKENLDAARAAEEAGNWEGAFNGYAAARLWGMGYTPSDLADNQRAADGVINAYLKMPVKPALPEAARRYVVQARTYIGDKRFADALKALDVALSLAPWFPTFYYDKALVSAELRNYSLAIASMNYYLKLVPDAQDARQVQDKIYEWEARMK